MATPSLYPSMRMFESMEQTRFHHEKNKFLLKNLPASYQSASVRKRWGQLIHGLNALLPKTEAAGMKAFYRERLGTIDRKSVIRLDQVVAYFEIFYFLYGVTQSIFSLNENQKKSLLEDIKLALEAGCEPGKQQKFENAIRWHQRDLNWVVNALQQLRNQLLFSLHDAYNEEHFNEQAYQEALLENGALWQHDGINHRFDDEFHVWDAHTLSVMTKLAEQKKLGIITLQPIEDIHVARNADLEKRITQYFNARYENVFLQQYPSKIVNVLVQHCHYEITTLLQRKPHKLNLGNWKATQLSMSLPTFNQLTDLLELLFKGHSPVSQLVKYDELTGDTYLCKQPQLLSIIEACIREKLCNEGFVYDLTKPTPALNKPELFHPLCQNELMTLKEFNALLSNKHTIRAQEVNSFLMKHLSKKNDLSYVFNSLFIEHPQLIYSLPKSVRQHIGFSSALLAHYHLVLSKQDDYPSSHIKALTYLYQNDHSIIELMSPKLLNNRALLSALIHVTGSAFCYAPAQLQCDESLAFKAVSANGLAIFHASETLKNNHALIVTALRQLDMPVSDKSTYDFNAFEALLCSRYLAMHIKYRLAGLEQYLVKEPFRVLDDKDHKRMLALETLLTQKNVSSYLMRDHAKVLHPKILLLVIKKRKQFGLPTLPLCRENTLKAFLNVYNSGFASNNALLFCANDLSFSALRQAILLRLPAQDNIQFGSNKYELKQLCKLFIHHNNWFDAFCEYQRLAPELDQPFNSMQDLWLQILLSTKAFFYFGFYFVKYAAKLLFDMINFLARFFIIFSLMLVASFSVSFVLTSVFSLSFMLTTHITYQIFVFLFSVLNQLPLLEQADNFFTIILFNLQKVVHYIFPEQALNALWNTLRQCFDFFETERNLLRLAIFPWFSRTYASVFSKELTGKEKVENIIRELQQKRVGSADNKADVLNDLWNSIQSDKSYLNRTMTLCEALNKEYEFMYQGASIVMSFSEVSKCHRTDNDTFQLEAPSKKWCGLFHAKTRSESFLSDILDNETFDRVNGRAMEI